MGSITNGMPSITKCLKIDPYLLSSYEFDIPEELIAHHPIEPRDSSRLMIVDRKSGTIDEAHFSDLPSILKPHDALIVNNSRVLHARLFGFFENGKPLECLLTKITSSDCAWAMMKSARKLQIGSKVSFDQGLSAEVLEIDPSGARLFRFSKPLTPKLLEKVGSVPLPPYIRKGRAEENDKQRYQTVYNKEPGSVAAPTAGLHFTENLLQRLHERDIDVVPVTLHVGTGTFLPIRMSDIRDHKMHKEFYSIPQETISFLNTLPKTSRKVAVGSTSLRVLESATTEDGFIKTMQGETDLFIYPGYTFKTNCSLITNFHVPSSSLLVLVSAFMGYELMRESYQKAIERKFRFFSYGDAMFIL